MKPITKARMTAGLTKARQFLRDALKAAQADDGTPRRIVASIQKLASRCGTEIARVFRSRTKNPEE